jgi:predicted nucleotidyltransferase component of viral defense system
MVQMIPKVAKEECFALKGGTAINLFWREMPRLSVDLDLTYLPIEDRETSLAHISKALGNIALSIENVFPFLRVQRSLVKGTKQISKLAVASSEVRIKIEVNEVIRGAVFPSIHKHLCHRAEAIFEKSASIVTLSFADLYGGKLCAALDRQHPRDVFDMKVLLEHEGITDDIRKAFLVYLVSHDRPMNEMIEPNRRDLRQAFRNEFLGMTQGSLTLEELVSVREKYIQIVSASLSDSERRFLISFKEGMPDWGLLGVPDVWRLPAVAWKLQNIRSLKEQNKPKHAQSLMRLKAKLGV